MPPTPTSWEPNCSGILIVSTCFYTVGVSSWSFKKGVISPTFLWQVRTVKFQKNHKPRDESLATCFFLTEVLMWFITTSTMTFGRGDAVGCGCGCGCGCGLLWLVVVCCCCRCCCCLLIVVCCVLFVVLHPILGINNDSYRKSLSWCLFVATQLAKHVCQPENLSQMSGWISKKLPPTLPETNSKNASKWMVGILLYFPIGEAYFQGRTVSFTEGSYNPNANIVWTKKCLKDYPKLHKWSEDPTRSGKGVVLLHTYSGPPWPTISDLLSHVAGMYITDAGCSQEKCRFYLILTWWDDLQDSFLLYKITVFWYACKIKSLLQRGQKNFAQVDLH